MGTERRAGAIDSFGRTLVFSVMGGLLGMGLWFGRVQAAPLPVSQSAPSITEPVDAESLALPSEFLPLIQEARLSRNRGELSRALELYGRAWETGKGVRDPQGFRRVNGAVGEYLELLSGLGRVEELAAIVGEYEGGRSAEGMDEALGQAQRSLWAMRNDPGRSFKCGVYSLAKVGRALGMITAERDVTAAWSSPAAGFSLWDLREVGAAWGLGEVSVVKQGTGDWVYPSVAHLRAGHFVALLEERSDGWVRVADSTQALGRTQVWWPRTGLKAELDGYFAVVGEVPEGYAAVPEAEAREVRGTGVLEKAPEKNEQQVAQAGQCPLAGSGTACGHLRLSLGSGQGRAYDPILRWDNAWGDAIAVEVGEGRAMPWFGQDPDTQHPTGVGNWQVNWSRYIGQANAGDAMSWRLYTPTYGQELTLGQTPTVESGTGCSLYKVAGDAGVKFADCRSQAGTWEVRYRSGGKEIYSPIEWGDGGGVQPVVWQLTAVVSAHGTRITIDHGVELDVDKTNPSGGSEWYSHLVTQIRDEKNEVAVSFSYSAVDKDGKALLEPVLTKICDKVKRCAQLKYQAMSGGLARLVESVDRDGVVSTYGYGSGEMAGRVVKVTTPQGEVVWNRMNSTSEGHLLSQLDYFNADKTWLGSERVVYVPNKTPYVADTEVAPATPTGPINNAYLDQRNVLHITPENWGAAFSSLDADSDGVFEYEEGDKNKNGRVDWNEAQTLSAQQVSYARVFHYAHEWGIDDPARSAQLESVLLPAPELGKGVRVWFTRAGVNATYEATDSNVLGRYVLLDDKGTPDTGDDVTVASSQTYNAQGQVLTATDPDGYQTEFVYEADGLRVKEIWAGGKAKGTKVKSFTYDADAPYLPATITDARGNVTRLDFDGYQRLRSVTDPYEHKTLYNYDDSHGRLRQIEYPQAVARNLPMRRAFIYDSYQRLSETTSNLPNEAWFKYSYWDDQAQGRYSDQIKEVSAYSWQFKQKEQSQTFDWRDSAGRITLDIHKQCQQKDDGDGVIEEGEASSCLQLTYNGWRRVAWHKDAVGAQTWLRWRGPGQLAQLQSTDGTVWDYRYAAQGQLVWVNQSKASTPGIYTQNPETFAYDRLGRLLKRVYPSGKSVTYGYTKAGRPDWINYSDSNDIAGLMCDASGKTCDADFTWETATLLYPRLASAQDKYGKVGFSYGTADPFLVTEESRSLATAEFAGGGAIVTTRAYDKLGRISDYALDGYYDAKSKTSKQTRTLYKASDSGLDAFNRVVKWQNLVGYGWRAYKGTGGLVTGTWLNMIDDSANATTLDFRYFDAFDRLTDAQLYLPEGYGENADVPSLDYQAADFTVYGSAQQVTRVLKYQGADQVLKQGFDAVNQALWRTDETDPTHPWTLESVTINANKHVTNAYTASSSSQNDNRAFTLLSEQAGQIDGVEVKKNVSLQGSYDYSYGPSGNATQDDRYTYDWNARWQLASKTHRSSGAVTRFGYDFANRPVWIQETDKAGTVVRRQWLEWNGDRVVQVRKGDDPTWVLATLDEDGIVDHAAAKAYYRFNDLAGSPVAYVDVATGATVSTWTYDLAGQSILVSGVLTGAMKYLGFQGLFVDGSSGQLVGLLRQYDPPNRRWLAEDPNGPMVDGPGYAGNLTHGFGNNSLAYADRQGGFLWVLAGGAAGALVGGGLVAGYEYLSYGSVNWNHVGVGVQFGAAAGAGVGIAAWVLRGGTAVTLNLVAAQAVAVKEAAPRVVDASAKLMMQRQRIFEWGKMNLEWGANRIVDACEARGLPRLGNSRSDDVVFYMGLLEKGDIDDAAHRMLYEVMKSSFEY